MLIVRRHFVHLLTLISRFSQRLDVPCEWFTNRFQLVQLLLLLKDNFIQFLYQVILEGNFCFYVY